MRSGYVLHQPARLNLLLSLLAGVLLPAHLAAAPNPPLPVSVAVAGDWSVLVEYHRGRRPVHAVFDVPPPALISIDQERYESLPVFNAKTAGWIKGVQLKHLRAQETTTPFLLEPDSVAVSRADPQPDDPTFVRGRDYDFDAVWGTVGRLPEGRIADNTAVHVRYRYSPLRIDSIVETRSGRLELRAGEPKSAAPQPPGLRRGERRLANLWIPGRIPRLEPKHLFPIAETDYRGPALPSDRSAKHTLPKTYHKLRSGQAVRILAWGDSVTDGSYLPNPDTDRWQSQFVRRLQAAFPRAKIELVTEAWGGRNTGSYLAEPPGSPHNYREKVLGAKPDLVVSEFVNDAGLSPAQVQDRYGQLLRDFNAIGAEWVILTPHYVRPDWMGIDRERDIDDDPRPYVAGLRQFATQNPVALADASLRYGRLWRQGIPYTSLMLNSINHPDAQGMSLFADALMELFR